MWNDITTAELAKPYKKGCNMEEAKNETLLPCPFCGGEPASYWIEGPHHNSRNNPDHFRIACCVTLEARTAVEAADKWNRRAALSFVAGAAGEREAKPSEGAQRDAKDAERYRWLKQDFSPMGLDIDGNHYWVYRRNASLRGNGLDAAIDAARGKQS